MSTEVSHDRNAEKHIGKQIGCMSGFLKFLDRPHTKRLPAPKNVDLKSGKGAANCEEKHVAPSGLIQEPQKTKTMTFPIPELYKLTQPPVSVSEMPPKSPQLFQVNESGGNNSWKFSPRLSLDSRATFDAAKGTLYRKDIHSNSTDGDNTRRSTSVIAKLMGIEPMPNSSSSQPIIKHVELRRSASESRATREIFQSRLVDSSNSSDKFKVKQQNHISSNLIGGDNVDPFDKSLVKSDQTLRGGSKRNLKSPQQRKSFYNPADIFPEPNHKFSIYGDIERRLKMRGIDQPRKDLETLKQILEAMQLKGLLHSKPVTQIRNKDNARARIYPYSSEAKSPIVLMKPNRRVGPPKIRSKPDNRQGGSSVSPRPQRQNIDGNVTSQTRGRPNPLVKTKPLSIETPRRVNESTESRRGSPINSPRRNVAHQTVTNTSPRNRRPTGQTAKDKSKNTVSVEDDTSSSISESNVSTPSQTDTERCKTEYTEGRRLLNRCDKLLNSIAEMNATESQPSPVSVLDSSFYKDDSCSPPPVMKHRNISFPVEMEEETGSPEFSCVQSMCEDVLDDSDSIYISHIFRAWNNTSKEANNHIFVHLEKQHYLKCKDNSKLSKLQRRLIFDTVVEIMERSSHLPPWQSFSMKTWQTSRPSLEQICSEIQKLQEHQSSEDLFEVICRVLKKDLAGDASMGWGDYPTDKSEVVLDIERLIFKDLVGESIRELSAKSTYLAPRRKLVF